MQFLLGGGSNFFFFYRHLIIPLIQLKQLGSFSCIDCKLPLTPSFLHLLKKLIFGLQSVGCCSNVFVWSLDLCNTDWSAPVSDNWSPHTVLLHCTDTLHSLLYTILPVQCTVSFVHCKLYCYTQQSYQHCTTSTLNSVLCTQYTVLPVQCKVSSVHCTVHYKYSVQYSVLFTLYTVLLHSTVLFTLYCQYCVQCTMYCTVLLHGTVWCTLYCKYSVHCTMYCTVMLH